MNKKLFLITSLLLAMYISWSASSIVFTFVASISVAYLLEPLADCISKKFKIRYTISASIVFFVFISLFIAAITFLIPKLLNQLELLALKVPLIQETIQNTVIPAISDRIHQFGPDFATQAKKMILDVGSSFGNVLGYSVNLIWSYLRATLHLITMCLLFPILLFFFLKDWQGISKKFKKFISKLGYGQINSIWKDIDKLISGFIKALLNVSIILGVIYTAGLSLIGFEFALIFGILAGIAVIIPFIGPIIAISSCLIMSVLLHGFAEQQLWIVALFAGAQALDSSFLTPKIVGDSIGLHPTAIIFSVFAASHILGATGLFLAIPIAGTIRIIFNKFILNEN